MATTYADPLGAGPWYGPWDGVEVVVKAHSITFTVHAEDGDFQQCRYGFWADELPAAVYDDLRYASVWGVEGGRRFACWPSEREANTALRNSLDGKPYRH